MPTRIEEIEARAEEPWLASKSDIPYLLAQLRDSEAKLEALKALVVQIDCDDCVPEFLRILKGGD